MFMAVKKSARFGLIAVILLAVLAGFFDYPKPWNAAASWARETAGVPVPNFPTLPFRLGLDLQGGTHLVYEADVREIPEEERGDSLSGVRDVIERRVNVFGVSEPVVQTSKSGDSWRVAVELAGVKDINEAIKLIGETPVLEFREQGAGEQRELTEKEKEELNNFNLQGKVKADEALKKALAPGADFGALVKEISEGSEKTQVEGDLGFIGLTPGFQEIVLAFDKARLGANKVFPNYVENDDGFHIVKYTEKRIGERKVRASHILVCFEGAKGCNTSTTKEVARKAALELRRKVNSKNFAELARENSNDPTVKSNNGDIGYFLHRQMVKPVADAAFAGRIGSIFGPVESEFGFHIIYKTDDRVENQYKTQRIFIDKKTPADIAPPLPWQVTGLGGKQLKRASVQFDPTTGEPSVSLDFNDEGKELFAQITTRNVDKFVAIFLDGQPISIPRVLSPITGGQAVITGDFTIPEARELARRLNAGALPVPIKLVSQVSVGPTLGKISLEKSLMAGLIGFALVALFMIVYYRFSGLAAVLALLGYTAFVLAMFKLTPVTLTLAGIAGFIITLGMAVDGNVLIFARMKEELGAGKSISAAMEDGFARSWPSIRDGHFTTLISAAILFWFSSSVIKGFALTLFIGVLFSLFSSVVVTRLLMRAFVLKIKNEQIWIGVKKKN